MTWGSGCRAGGLVVALAAIGCRSGPAGPADAGSAVPPAQPAQSASAAPLAGARPGLAGALIANARGDALYVADEDGHALHVVALPLDPRGARRTVKLPGAPAQAAVIGDRVLVTIRDPGLLVELSGANLEETGRVALPSDAWGLAITPDARTAIVTSAWTHQISIVDLAARRLVRTFDVPREPRGVVVADDGHRAYVTHLVGTSITRVDLDGAPRVTPVDLPPARTHARRGAVPAASLAYSAALSADGKRLFVPRQALSADGKRPWNGQATVDVLLTASDTALAEPPARVVRFRSISVDRAIEIGTGRGPFLDVSFTGGFAQPRPPFVQPRAVVVRRATRTLLVASEGTDELVELDALAVEPAGKPLGTYDLGLVRKTPPPDHRFGVIVHDRSDGSYDVRLEDGSIVRGYDRAHPIPGLRAGDRVSYQPPKTALQGLGSIDDVLLVPGPRAGDTRCGAPSGIALSADEATAYVFCRATFDVAAVPLDRHDGSPPSADAPLTIVHLADDPLTEEAARGRRLFYSARDPLLSEWFGCAGCHPEGRDDGHVWREMVESSWQPVLPSTASASNEGPEPAANYEAFDVPIGSAFMVPIPSYTLSFPRQTPMLAGRVAAKGPYGWHGRSPDLVSRILRGASIHRWGGSSNPVVGTAKERAIAIAAFLREGLVPPPREERDLTPQEMRGRELFNDPFTGCATCHPPANGYTTRAIVPMRGRRAFGPKGPMASDDAEPNRWFKTPSLLFVGGTPPYLHDGSAATLEELIDANDDRMGHTLQLTSEERAALVAFLRTL